MHGETRQDEPIFPGVREFHAATNGLDPKEVTDEDVRMFNRMILQKMKFDRDAWDEDSEKFQHLLSSISYPGTREKILGLLEMGRSWSTLKEWQEWATVLEAVVTSFHDLLVRHNIALESAYVPGVRPTVH